jgi:hypothetical protein
MFPELGSKGIIRVAFVQWPEGLAPGSDRWASLAEEVVASTSDPLITNELPFGTWLASSGVFDHAAAEHSVALHAVSRKQKAEYPNYVQESLLPLDQ